MSDRPPPKKRPPGTRPPTAGLGQDLQDQRLQGIAPAVVDAFLAKPKQAPPEEPEEVRGLFAPTPVAPPKIPELTLPRDPEFLGAFRAETDSVDVKARFKKIQALAKAAREIPLEPPPEEPADPRNTRPLGSGALDPMRAQLLAKRKRPPGTSPMGTGPIEPGTNKMKLEHLALRAKAKGTGTGLGTDGKTLGKLEKTIEATLGAKGALKLRQSIKALEDKALPGKLSALAESVNKLLPEGSEHYAKLGLEVGKQVLQNNVNPLLAVSMSLKEIGERMEELEKWEHLSNKERVGNMTMLVSSVSEILGAVTPPPVSYGIQVLGAGMLLMGMAAEHSEAVEDLAKAAGSEKASKAIANSVDGASGHIANRVKNAWDELSDRLAIQRPKKPRLPNQLQAMVDSPAWKAMKKHPQGKNIAEGAENMMYNLAKRREALSARWDHKVGKIRKKRRPED